MKFQYIPVPGGAAVLSCTGAGSSVRLPETVGGLAVREICPYAFSDPEAAAARLPAGAEPRSEEEGPAMFGGDRFLGGSSLREVLLPAGIRSIGEYAFYNCTGLRRVRLSAGPARIGNGAFMNCGGLSELLFDASPEERTCLPGLLAEVPQEVRVLFRSQDGETAWIFPEYYEESVENAPAHIFEHFIHGAGYRYRQCFREDVLDAEAYDGQFPLAKPVGRPETLLKIALERLRRPLRLSPEAAERYRAHLGENAAAAAGLLVREDDPEGLSFLTANGIFTRESIGAAAEEAARLGRARCLAVLLRERNGRFPPKKKTFDL